MREYYSVAVVKRDSDIRRLSDIRGKKACFSGVGNLAGWVMPIAKVSRRQHVPPALSQRTDLPTDPSPVCPSCSVSAD